MEPGCILVASAGTSSCSLYAIDKRRLWMTPGMYGELDPVSSPVMGDVTPHCLCIPASGLLVARYSMLLPTPSLASSAARLALRTSILLQKWRSRLQRMWSRYPDGALCRGSSDFFATAL